MLRCAIGINIVVLAASLAACSSRPPAAAAPIANDVGHEDSAPEVRGHAGSGGSAKAVPFTLTKLGLKVDVPKGASQDEMLGGDTLILAPGFTFSVREANDDDPKSVDEEKKESEIYSAKNHTDEQLADGYLFRFENTGAMGENYWLKVRREIGGTTYYCSTVTGDKSITDNAARACKSLRQ